MKPPGPEHILITVLDIFLQRNMREGLLIPILLTIYQIIEVQLSTLKPPPELQSTGTQIPVHNALLVQNP